MALGVRHILGALCPFVSAVPASAGMHPALDAFAPSCFKARQTIAHAQAKMALQPLFGTAIPLTEPYAWESGAVVHFGTHEAQTCTPVDRLLAGMERTP